MSNNKGWKQLFHEMWISDKPIEQEKCADNIASITVSKDTKYAFQFFRDFLTIMLDEYFNIDHFRLDKFLMLSRRMLRKMFEVLNDNQWKSELVIKFNKIVSQTILCKERNEKALGFAIYVVEIFVEELAKVTNGKIAPGMVSKMLKPFIRSLFESKNSVLCDQIKTHLFDALIKQSDLGIIFEKKFRFWQMHNFVTGSIDCIEFEAKDETMDNDSDSEVSQSAPKDPRAGHVDVLLPQVKFDASLIVDLFENVEQDFGTKNRVANAVKNNFIKMNKGVYPLGLKKVPTVKNIKTDTKKAVKRLQKFEKRLYLDTKLSSRRKKKIT